MRSTHKQYSSKDIPVIIPDVIMLVFRHFSPHTRMQRHTLDPLYDGLDCSVSIQHRVNIYISEI